MEPRTHRPWSPETVARCSHHRRGQLQLVDYGVARTFCMSCGARLPLRRSLREQIADRIHAMLTFGGAR